MITEDFFFSKVHEAAMLLGKRIPKDTVAYMFERLMNVRKEDFVAAIEEIIESGDERVQINYPMLRRLINKHMTIRIERDMKKMQEREEEEARNFWRMDGGKVDCKNREGEVHRCDVCTVRYCRVILSEAVQAIKTMFDQGIPYEEVAAELSKFRGMGWDGEEPF